MVMMELRPPPEPIQEQAFRLRLLNPVSQRRLSCRDRPASSLQPNLTWVSWARGSMMIMVELVVERRTCPMVDCSKDGCRGREAGSTRRPSIPHQRLVLRLTSHALALGGAQSRWKRGRRD